jgi:hypothetical protein
VANEISLSTRLKVKKGSLAFDTGTVTQQANLSGTRFHHVVTNVGTTYQSLAIPAGIGTPGESFFKNTDATNFIEIGLEVASTFHPLVKLKPGRTARLPLSTDALFARANTAAVDLEVFVLED